jgi:hypothetical protein
MSGPHLTLIPIVFGLCAASCTRAPSSDLRSLEDLASGKESLKVCAGPYTPDRARFEDRVVYDDGVDRARFAPVIERSLTAVPNAVRDVFSAVGGKVLITPKAAELCRTDASSAFAASSCFKVGGKIGGRQEGLTIVLEADEAVVMSRTVRAFGYVVSQYFSRLHFKDGGLELSVGMNTDFKKKQQDVGEAFLRDVGYRGNDQATAEKASRAFAEAFDSYYRHV